MKRKNVKQSALELLARRGRATSGDLARAAGVTRQTAHAALAGLVSEGVATAAGAGRGVHYLPSGGIRLTWLTQGLEEHEVWEEVRFQLPLAGISDSAVGVFGYAVSEMVNNVIDHSGSDILVVRLSRDGYDVVVVVEDGGLGVFERIRMERGLPDYWNALEQLSKGKLTTDPDHHTGEGIFFTSKLVDRFTLAANGIEWTVDNAMADFAAGESSTVVGTQIVLRHRWDSDRRTEDVFDAYTTGHSFDTSRVVVRLFERGESFVSRSEARRIASGLEAFARVIVDFRGVRSVGQGFVDELFRVWASQHPQATLEPVEMNDAVSFMVRRGLPS